MEKYMELKKTARIAGGLYFVWALTGIVRSYGQAA